MRYAIYIAIIILGGSAVFRLTPGPGVAAFGALIAFQAAVGIAMYFIERRLAPRG